MAKQLKNTDKLLINECDLDFSCPQTWDKLEVTIDPKVRYCHQCERGVHLIESEDDIKPGQRYCIAYHLDESRMIVGEIDPSPYKR